ncbi:MAG: hypothetical protein SGPRY_001554 [Prymnesium sp.]
MLVSKRVRLAALTHARRALCSRPQSPLQGSWLHGSYDAERPAAHEEGTASMHSVLVGTTTSLLCTELIRGMSLTFAMFMKEKVTLNYPNEKGALPVNSVRLFARLKQSLSKLKYEKMELAARLDMTLT